MLEPVLIFRHRNEFFYPFEGYAIDMFSEWQSIPVEFMNSLFFKRPSNGCQTTVRLQPCHFFRRRSPPVLNRRCESGHSFRPWGDHIWIDKLLNPMKAYISETYRDYISGPTYNIFRCMLKLFTMLDNVTGFPHPENGISPQRGGGLNPLYQFTSRR
jgi:hypothetical protein